VEEEAERGLGRDEAHGQEGQEGQEEREGQAERQWALAASLSFQQSLSSALLAVAMEPAAPSVCRHRRQFSSQPVPDPCCDSPVEQGEQRPYPESPVE
jgi:hypothetical protein